MFTRISFIISFIVIFFVHLSLLANYQVKNDPIVVAPKPSVIPIALRKITIKQTPQKKVEKKIVKKVTKPKKKKFKKIVKKSLNKILKQPKKKIVKKEPKKKIKKEQVKLVQTTTQKIKPRKIKKPVISQVVKNTIQNEYLLKIKAHIEKHKKYPKRAKRLKQQGKVMLSFTVLENGAIQDAKIIGKSPYKRLNTAALKILHTINQFDPIPKELNKNSWQLNVPINYSIINI